MSGKAVCRAHRDLVRAMVAVTEAMVDLHNARSSIFEPSVDDLLKRSLGGHPLDYPPLEETDGRNLTWLRGDGSRA